MPVPAKCGSLVVSIFILHSLLHSAEPLQFPSVPPTPPAEAGKTFEALHDFKMELIAAEPMVCDPVAITYDEDGRAFVCEMSDYPYTDKAHHKASQENPTDASIGKVRLLVDTDGDGVFDKATIFADGLSWPTGSVCWRGGIIVVATPDIWYLKDTDGDGVADVRQKLFTGLKKLNIQAVANNPIWGLDNMIYIAGGSNGGTLQNLVHPEKKPITFRRNDLILDPVKMTIELASGGARFGNTRDDWGNRFLCNIRNPLEHVVIEQRYLARNPYLPPVNPLADVAESGDQLPVYRISPPEQWREFRAKRWTGDSTVASHMPKSELVGSGVVTSSSGCTIYRGDAYPPEFRGQAFVADVAGNLFYRLNLTPDGVTFKGTRIDGKKEMVASRDIWFRPVNFANAPDGTLTVCDMYREVIEHPWSLPDDIHAALDLERGRDMGRLYRLAPPSFKFRKAPQLSMASATELVTLLAHPNAWHRDTAHRLLFERQDKSTVPALKKLVPDPERLNAHSELSELLSLEAMWILEGMNELSDASLRGLLYAGLDDSQHRVREQAIRLADTRLPRAAKLVESLEAHKRKGDTLPDDLSEFEHSPLHALYTEVPLKIYDESLHVRFQTALSLGAMPGTLATGLLAELGFRDAANPWERTAILCSAGTSVGNLMEVLGRQQASDGREDYFIACAGIAGASGNVSSGIEAIEAMWFMSAVNPVLAEKALAEFTQNLRRTGKSPLTLADPSRPFMRFNYWLDDVVNEKTKAALNSDCSVEDRTRAIALLALLEFPKVQPIAAKLLAPTEPDAVRVATIKLLGQQRDAKVADLLLEAWPTLTPAPREAALQAMVGKPLLTGALLTAIEQGRIKPAEISPTARTLLSKASDVKLRERAAKLFAPSGTRSEAIAKYETALTLKADAAAGHKVYQTICAACHRKGDEGRDIGPNLATIMSWSSEQMLTNILDPNREVSPNFLLYIVETNDGRTLSGLITSETPTSVALKGADGVEQSVSRSEVKSLKSAGISLMPEGLEASSTPQQMADLMAFLKS